MSSGKNGFSFTKLGIGLMVVSTIAILFCVYMLAFGVRADAKCTDIKGAKNKYILIYSYTVDGKEYTTSERVSIDKLKDADTDKTEIIYLKQMPSVTYDNALFILSGMAFAIGLGFYYSTKIRQTDVRLRLKNHTIGPE